MKYWDNIIIQTKLEGKTSIARVRCSKCHCDYFELIEKGRNKELICEECEEEFREIDKIDEESRKA